MDIISSYNVIYYLEDEKDENRWTYLTRTAFHWEPKKSFNTEEN